MTDGTERPPRPARADLEVARGRTVPDVVAPGLRVLFVGINPGLYTAGIGITNVVVRATASAEELTADELRGGGERLRRKVRRLRPGIVASSGSAPTGPPSDGRWRVSDRSRSVSPGAACGSCRTRAGSTRTSSCPARRGVPQAPG